MAESPEQSPSYQRILDAANALFVEKGFPATSMGEIARRAKVVRATVYNNFADKEAIVEEIMRRYIEGYVGVRGGSVSRRVPSRRRSNSSRR